MLSSNPTGGRARPKIPRPGYLKFPARSPSPRLLIVHLSLVHQVCTGYDFMRPAPHLRLLFYVALGIFLRRRRPGLARQGWAASHAGTGSSAIPVYYLPHVDFYVSFYRRVVILSCML